MRRREVLRMLGRAGTLAGAWALGIAAPLGGGLCRSARRTLRVPIDLLARIRRRTRPLDERSLDEAHHLVG